MATEMLDVPLTAAKKKRAVVELEPDVINWHRSVPSILDPERRTLIVTIGIRLKSQGSGWSHNWRASHGRSQQLRKRMMHMLARIDVDHVTRFLGGGPRKVSFVRLAPRQLDDDNLRSAFKPIRDQVVCWLALDNSPSAKADDGMRSGYEFTYHQQQQQKLYGIRVELGR